MKRFFALGSIFVVGLTLAAMLFVSCTARKPVLRLYNWADYMEPELITAFEQQFNCQVVVDNFDSNEAMYAKLKAGATGYDLLFPSDYMVTSMAQQEMIQPIDHTKIPNLKYIDPAFLQKSLDPEMKFSVPYLSTATGVGYNTEHVKDVESTWAIFERADMKGRMTMLNDMREAIGAALKFLGFSINTVNEQELAQAQEVLIRWKKNLAKFDVDEAKRGLATGEFFVVQQYSGDILQVMEENKQIAFFIPREGTSFATDHFVIPKDAQNVELAHSFINFMQEPANCAKNMEYVYYLAPNLEAQKLVSDEFRADESVFIPAEILDRCEVIRDLGPDLPKYTKVWDAVKAAE